MNWQSADVTSASLDVDTFWGPLPGNRSDRPGAVSVWTDEHDMRNVFPLPSPVSAAGQTASDLSFCRHAHRLENVFFAGRLAREEAHTRANRGPDGLAAFALQTIAPRQRGPSRPFMGRAEGAPPCRSSSRAAPAHRLRRRSKSSLGFRRIIDEASGRLSPPRHAGSCC